MPSLESEQLENLNIGDDGNRAEKTLSGPIIGIIYPPPEVRNIVDKTASFVARNGPEFEARIRQNELGNPKFNFLNSGDPYHAYYQHKVNEFREGKPDAASTLPANVQKLQVSTAAHLKQQEILKQVAEQQFVPKEAPPDFEFIADPPSISALDLDIVKLTAQFVARNGRQFLTNLMNREQRNYQFDFLRPQHSLFQYFTKLLEQYTKILIPPKDLMGRLKSESSVSRESSNMVLEQVKYRANWQRHQEAQRKREEEKIERERVAYAQIDWHDFVVVETVDYQPFETGNFPPPTTPDEVGARVLMEERMMEEDGDIEMQIDSDDGSDNEGIARVKLSTMENRIGMSALASSKKDNIQVQDMDESSDDESNLNEKSAPITPLLPPTHDKVVIKKYDPKQAQKPVVKAAPTDEFLISPITGEKIPASKMAEHMRIGLLDPRWIEQRDKHTVDKLNQDNVFAAGTAIEASLKQLAERRTDIFGVGDEETVIGKKLGEEETRKDERVTWDGHTSSVEAATRAARANITLEDQIHQIHKVKGLLPDEEKEKIGPKPVGGPSTSKFSGVQIVAQQQQQQQQQSIQPTQQQSQPPQQPVVSQAPPMAPDYRLSNIPNEYQRVPVPGEQQAAPMPQIPMPPPVMMMPRPPMMPPPFPMFRLPVMEQMEHTAPQIPIPPQQSEPEEPPSKKQRSEDSLVPEFEFMSAHSGPVSLQIQAPSGVDKPEWRLNGQIISITVALNDTISTLKSKIQEETGLPPAKQKISYEGMFFKDNNSIAFYNLLSGTTVQLQIKERGGRKK